MLRAGAALLVISACLAASRADAAAAAMQQPTAPPSSASAGPKPDTTRTAPLVKPLPPGTRLNPTGHDISLSGPLRSGKDQLGDVDFILGADDSLRINGIRLVEALKRAVEPAALADLQARIASTGFVPAEQLAQLGYPVAYDSETVGLAIDIPSAARPTHPLSLYQYATPVVGEFDAPAGVSGYVNFRNFLSYDWSGVNRGFDGPTSFIDSAIRFHGVVFENQAILDANSQSTFRRQSTRFVYDDRKHLARWELGDLQPLSRGFAGAPEMAGLGVQRIYSQLDPLLLVQPRGNRTFTLDRPATVQAVINGQPVRQFRLQPGTYNISDFPFAQGSNDVQLRIQDDSGIQQTIAFSIFFDRSLLAEGRTEFGLYAGFLAPQTITSRDYQFDHPAASGFFRRGISDTVTAGANFNVQQRGAVGGLEAIWANLLGTFGLDVALSDVKNISTGYAFNASYTTIIGSTGTSLGAAVEYHSTNFADPSQFTPLNRYSWDLTATLSQRLFGSQALSVTARHALGRNGFRDETSVRAQYGWQINHRLYLTSEALYQDGAFARHDFSFRIRLTVRLSGHSSGYAQFDSFDNRGQIGFDTTSGNGVGSLALAGDVSVGAHAVGLDASAAYIANRADIGLEHATLFDIGGTRVDSERTTFRLGTSIVFADGHFALSRPIYDSFVMGTTHKTLHNATIYLDPSQGSYEARSDFLGPAVEPNLSSYIPRVVTYDVPNAPSGYDIGSGALRAFPPYRSGYLITAGSDYSLTVVGTLLDPEGKPISLIAGRAIELAHPDRPSVTIFTNRAGRFGISGLRPGRWRIEMPTQPPSSVEIEVPQGANGLVRMGDVKLGDR